MTMKTSLQMDINEQYALIGKTAMLMANSPMHRHFSMSDLRGIILPAVNLNQYRLYENEQKEAIGFVSWGFFSDEVEKKFLSGTAVLKQEDWQSGDTVYVTDFITRGNGIAQKIVHDLKTIVFPDSIVHALRFDKPGQPRGHVSRYRGINVENAAAKAA